jgi:hypothetical protein
MTTADLPDMPDEDAALKELIPLYEINEPLTVALPPRAWFVIVGALQLVSRHPSHSLSPQLKEIGHHLQAALAPIVSNNVKAYLAWGWNPQMDVNGEGQRVSHPVEHTEFYGPSDTTPLVEQLLNDLGMADEVPEGLIPPHLRTAFSDYITNHPDIQVTAAPFEAFHAIIALQTVVQQSDVGFNSIEGISLTTLAHRITRELEIDPDLYHFLQQRWVPELQDDADNPLIPFRFFKGDEG